MTERLRRHEIPVVILCGGKGTRFREETEYRPKPMVEIGNQPILWHIMKIYGHFGFRRFILCLGYKGWIIKQYFLRYSETLRDFTVTLDGSRPLEFHNSPGDENWSVTCAETGAETGTGGRLWRVQKYIDAATFCFTYGDAVAAIDLDALLEHHHSEGRIATVTGVHPTSRYGEMHVEGSEVTEFNEKPTLAEGVVSGGFFVFQKDVFRYMTEEPELFLEQKPLQNLARDGQLSVYRHTDFWHPMDTYRDHLHLSDLWNSPRPPWKIWQE